MSESEFVISRLLDASPEKVFAVHAGAEHLAQWWGPKGLTTTVKTFDLQPGGVFHYSMSLPNGATMWGRFIYREVIPAQRLVFVLSFADASGFPVRAPFSAHWPMEVLNTVSFEEQDGKTLLTLHGVPINASDEERQTFVEGFASMQQGFGGTLDQLAAYLAKPG